MFYSAGVGRTGTFIALDALYKYGKKSTHVDIQGFVRKMRESRMTMVQNAVSKHVCVHCHVKRITYYNNRSL